MANETDLEKIYDEQISPHMQEIVRVCMEHDIPIVATFGLGEDATGNYVECSTGYNYWLAPEKTAANILGNLLAAATSGSMVLKDRDNPGSIEQHVQAKGDQA